MAAKKSEPLNQFLSRYMSKGAEKDKPRFAGSYSQLKQAAKKR